MTCKQCEKRRKEWNRKRAELSKQGKTYQARIMGAAIDGIDKAGQIIGRNSKGTQENS